MQRPVAIVWFERIIFGTLALGIVNSWLAWPSLVATVSPAFLLTVQAFTLGLIAGLTLLVSRRRSNVAKWILIGLFLIGLPMVAKQAVDGELSAGSPLITLVQTIGQIVAYALLFTAESRRWLKSERSAV